MTIQRQYDIDANGDDNELSRRKRYTVKSTLPPGYFWQRQRRETGEQSGNRKHDGSTAATSGHVAGRRG